MSTPPPMQPPGGPPPYQSLGGVPPYTTPAPYAPQGAPGYTMPVATVAYAGFWRRFLALLIDAIILGVIGAVLASILGLGSGSSGDGSVSFNLGGGGTLLNLVLDLIYFTLMIALVNGKTLGGMILGIRVVPADGGGNVSIGKALIRTVVAYVSGLVLLLGYLWMLWDRNKQTWHDKAAGTYVIRG